MGDIRSHIVFDISGGGLENFEELLQILVQLHNRSYIATSIIVVWGWPYGDQFLIEHKFIPLHYQLMCPCHKSESIVVAKVLHRVPAKYVPCSSAWFSPPFDLIWVRPKHIAHDSLLWNLFYSIYCLNIL